MEAEIADGYKRSDYYAHEPITKYMSEKEMAAFLACMQKQVWLFRVKKKE